MYGVTVSVIQIKSLGPSNDLSVLTGDIVLNLSTRFCLHGPFKFNKGVASLK